jgi:hypothetical protein
MWPVITATKDPTPLSAEANETADKEFSEAQSNPDLSDSTAAALVTLDFESEVCSGLTFLFSAMIPPECLANT